MKKMLIMLAVGLMVAARVNAASVNWQSGNMSTQGWLANGYPIGTVITYILGTTPAGMLTALESGTSLAAAMSTYSVTADGTKAIGGSPTYTANLSTGQAYAGFTPGQTATGYAFAFNSDNTQFIYATGTSFVFPAVGNAALTFSGSWAEHNISVVPEPTSFALLALGAAAVGIRRRLKK